MSGRDYRGSNAAHNGTASEEIPYRKVCAVVRPTDRHGRRCTKPQERRQEFDAHGTRPDLPSSMLLAHGDAFVTDSHRLRNRARVRYIRTVEI